MKVKELINYLQKQNQDYFILEFVAGQDLGEYLPLEFEAFKPRDSYMSPRFVFVPYEKAIKLIEDKEALQEFKQKYED